jgi:hypothetical protein
MGSELYHLLPLYKIRNRSIPKHFPIETISERTDSSLKNHGQVESIVFRSVLIGIVLLWTDLCKVTIGDNRHFRFFGELGLFDVVASFAYHIRILHGCLH